MVNEIYKLTLTHYMQDTARDTARENGYTLLEEPMIVEMIYDRTYGPAPVFLNQMLDTMKQGVLAKKMK